VQTSLGRHPVGIWIASFLEKRESILERLNPPRHRGSLYFAVVVMIADEIRYFFPLERRGTNLALGESSGNSWSDFFFSSVSSETESVRSFPARWTRVRVHRSTGAFRRLLLLEAPIQSRNRADLAL